MYSCIQCMFFSIEVSYWSIFYIYISLFRFVTIDVLLYKIKQCFESIVWLFICTHQWSSDSLIIEFKTDTTHKIEDEDS